jgi:signal transduction histidine kinase
MTIATRLTSFFLIAVALLLGGTSAALYLLVRTHLHHDMDERLVNVLDMLAAEAVDRPGTVEWRPGALGLPTGAHRRGESHVRWAVFDGQRTLIERAWNLGAEDLAAVLDLIPGSGHAHLSYHGHDGRRWRLALRRLQALPPRPTGEQYDEDKEKEKDEEDKETRPARGTFTPTRANSALFLATGEHLEPLEANLRNTALGLLGVSTVLWCLAALAGRRFCRRALRPMSRMAAVAQAMSAADGEHHLPSPGTGDELEDLASAFNGLLDRLHQTIERQRQFTGDASHQLRTPLTALIGELEVARRRERSPEEYRHVLDDAHAEAIHLREIVESLLFLARAEADAACPNLRPIDLATWLPTHLRNWSGHERGCDIRSEFPPPPMIVLAHAPLLGQLLDNLLENACKYSAPGTPIRVAVRREPGSALLIVEDRGVGLAPEELAHIFEPFYRSPSAHLRGQPGVGLGLAVVQRIAANFGATIHAESEPSQGTRFVVRFPEARLQ